MNSPQLIASGFLLGHEGFTNFQFDPAKPFRACLICGRVYQPELNRQLDFDIPEAVALRNKWAGIHGSLHSEAQHEALKQQGLTPEAAQSLAKLGILSLSDMVLNEEVRIALAEMDSTPNEDAEGGEL